MKLRDGFSRLLLYIAGSRMAAVAQPQNTPPLISVVMPAFNEEQLIQRSIAAVRESFLKAGWASYEIVVCDNNSTDRTAELARAAGARVAFEPHNQISRARNTGAAHALGQWLIFIDSDTFLNPALLKGTIERFESGKFCGGGAVLRFDRSSLGRFAAAMTSFWNRVSAFFHVAAGSYVYCYQEAWRDVGGFSESMYAGEELVFSRKVKRWGRKRGLKFKVLTEAPIITSARKLEWYSTRQLLWHMIQAGLPGALMKREACGLWYTRPPQPAVVEEQ